MQPDLAAFLRPTVLLAVALLAVIVMMVLPMPSWVLDIGLAASFALAILIFTVTLFIERPLDFSVFPTVLLASLMLRLSLNVSSTKLIIGQGHTGTSAAGNVIEGFAMFVMGGSLLIGLVVFCVLLIVNFIVINKGATRMAEVGARFALDGMPGRQLAIDADMSAGAISHEEAKARRETELAETTFFGSLDGASKFVKGDAIAGLLITVLNLVMGLLIGILLHDMPLAEAFESYAILTVGDGLVTQIPAVIISIASALLLARGGATGTADFALITQLGRFPAALGTVGLLMGLFALVPGLPFGPFLLGALLCAIAAFVAHSKSIRESSDAQSAPDLAPPEKPSIADRLVLDDIHLEFAPDLVNMVLDPAIGLDARIANIRVHVALSFGVILPEIRLTDDASLPPGTYRIKIHGVEQARDRLRPGQQLALISADGADGLAGEAVKEPVYGAPALWVDGAAAGEAAGQGLTVVQAPEVLATHLLEVVKRNFARLMTHRALRELLDQLVSLKDQRRAEANRRMFDELIPDKAPYDLLLAVLRLLLEDRLSIRNLPLILEATAEGKSLYARVDQIAEHVRQRLAFQIVAEHRREDGTVPLVQLSPEWDERFSHYETGPDGSEVALPPDAFKALASGVSDTLSKAAETGANPVLVTSARRRRFLQTVVRSRGLMTSVLSFDELGVDVRPALLGVVAA
ncbi:flagellar biosynthesis protein FlhA [Pelagovum sp. HNIBRBA483]|uniref:flagellar biosynthesis protein FlhA n=1 Tax=Pelagovum sp. HNIBRBA483 TaxID=3233341 RepID=UPI0034A2D60F